MGTGRFSTSASRTFGDDSVSTGPLSGLQVIELAHIMAGPVCGLMLADLGAEVIKVERAPDGDPSRTFVPPEQGGESAAFMMLNRNKRGIAVDLKAPEGRQIVRRLVRDSDVVIENFRAGTMERLGLAYETLQADNSGLILCEISGFGRTGPYADVGGFDLIAQGYSGLMSITGEGPDRAPLKCGAPVTDVTAGILGALGVMAAIIERNRTGQGQRVDTSLYEAGITQTFWHAAIAMATGVSPGPLGTAHPLSAPYEAFRTADGWITIGASNEATWRRLAPALERPHLLEDPRFRTNADRLQHRVALAHVLEQILALRPTDHWVQHLTDAGVPAGPVASIADMLAHPQTAAREMVPSVHHAGVGVMRTLGCPIKLSNSPTGVRRAAPVLGQHTREVLGRAGYDDARIGALAAAGIIVVSERG